MQPDAKHKRDILETEQYERLMVHICKTFSGAGKSVESAAKRHKCTVAEIYKRKTVCLLYVVFVRYRNASKGTEVLEGQ